VKEPHISHKESEVREIPDMAAERKTTYSRLFWRFVWLTILCSLVPLLLVGWGINLHYSQFARERMNHRAIPKRAHLQAAVDRPHPRPG
jgi:hypothetical protein